MKILAIDSMSTYATFDGKVANTYSADKNCKEFSFYSKMIGILMKGQYDVAVFEETRFKYVSSQRIMFGQLAILKVICHPLRTKIVTITPMEVKKLFTGSGKAKKEDMMAECDKRGIEYKNEHESDSIGIYYSYLKKYDIKE